MKKLALWNVGPLNNMYSGKHTYHDAWIPFANELIRQNIEVDWVGITLENRYSNPVLDEMGITFESTDKIEFSDKIKNFTKSKTWDFVDPIIYDALLCQPRPEICKLENEILFSLIRKFLTAGKKVFVWECDLMTSLFPDELRKECILLYPTQLKPKQAFKEEYYFPFFTHSEYAKSTSTNIKRDLDFLLIANIYGRNAQAEQFFGPMQDAPFTKTIFGSWIETEERRQFSSKFRNFEFKGNSEFWAANKLMRRARATLHIVPDFARDRGLMTARVFVSQMNKCLCFCDAGIVGAEKFFPPELIVKDGNEIVERWDYVQQHRERLLAERNELLKEHTVERRVLQFLELLNKTRRQSNFKYHTHSKSSRKKISDACIRILNSPEINMKMRKTRSIAAKLRMKNAAKGRVSNFKGCRHTLSARHLNRVKHLGKTHSEKTKANIRNKKLGRTYSNITKQKMKEWHIMHPKKKFSNTIIEQKTATELEQRGFIRDDDFFQNFGISGIKNVDFYLPKLNVVIECDGCFYHACPEHGHPKYHQHAPANDAKNTKLLEEAGYSVFRFWGHDINTSVEDCINKITSK